MDREGGDGYPTPACHKEPVKAESGTVDVDMWFLSRRELYKHTKPYMITFDTTDFAEPKTNHSYSKHCVQAHDARPNKSSFTLDIHGFEFHNWGSTLAGDMFDDDELVKKLYYPEVIKYAHARFPQCEHIYIFAHLVST